MHPSSRVEVVGRLAWVHFTVVLRRVLRRAFPKNHLPLNKLTPPQTQALRQVASARKAMARAHAAVEGAKSKQGIVVGTLVEVLQLLKQLLGVA